MVGIRNTRELTGDFVERDESKDKQTLHALKAVVRKVD